MNDVPLREHIAEIRAAERRTLFVTVVGLIAVGWAIVSGMEKATAVALTAATEKGVAHNGLIERMREMSRQYVTWPTVSLLMGLAVAIAALLLK